MDFDENYLDELLKSIEPIVGPSEDAAEESGEADAVPDMPEEELDSDVAEPMEAEPEEGEVPAPEPEPVAEIEPVAEPEPVPEPVAEAEPEPVAEPEAEDAPLTLTIDDLDPADGNKQLSAEEIAALFGSANAAADAAADEPATDSDDADSDISADLPEEPMEIDLDSPELASLLDDIDADSDASADGSGDDISLESLLDESESEDEAAAEPIEIDLSDEDAITDSLMGEGPSLSDLLAESSDGEEADGASDDASIDEEQVLSPEEIDAMLEAAQFAEPGETEASVTEGTSDDELMSLLAEAGDVDLEDIQHILDSDENGEALDSAALEAATTVEDVASDVLDTPEEAAAKAKEAKKAAKEAKKAAKKAKKGKKGAAEEGAEGVAEGEEGAEPKQGFFAKLLGILTEAVDDDENEGAEAAEGSDAAAGDTAGEPSEVANISDENKEIMEELDAEQGKKKGKKGKKDKKKKKGKGGEAEGEGAEGGEGEEGEGSGKKKKKERKKKEKAPKAEEVPGKPEKRLPKKRVRATFILCFSIMAGIIILTVVMTKLTNLEEARHAYENQDYQTAYEDLYGLELKGDDADIYAKSQIMLMLDRKLRSYQNYKKLGMDDRAVDALFEGVKMYPDLIRQAESYGVVPQVDYTYSQILAALGEYGISEDEAKEIAGYESKVKYTKRIDSIVHGTPFTYDEDIAAEDAAAASAAAPAAEEPAGQQVEDILPPETDFLPDDPNRIFDEGAPAEPPADGEGPAPVTDEGDV